MSAAPHWPAAGRAARRARCALALLASLPALPLLAAPPYVTAEQLAQAPAQRLSRDALAALLVPGSVSEFMSLGTQTGWVRRWHIAADGSLEIANRDVQNGWTFAGRGRWRIGRDGAYCLDVQWHTVQERWCRGVYRMGDALYLGATDLARDPQARLGRLTITAPSPATALHERDWAGDWDVEFKPWGLFRVTGTATLRPDGGRWHVYVYGDASRIAPCVARPLRIGAVHATAASVSFTIEMENVVRGCGDDRITLFKADDRTLEGQGSHGGAIRLIRR